jgi:hypothetical protein
MATCMLSGESANTNFIVFGLTQPELKLTIYCILGEHVNHYTTEVALLYWLSPWNIGGVIVVIIW